MCHVRRLIPVFILVSSSGSWAQGPVGTLNGTLLDQTESVVPGAVVVATNVSTEVEHRTSSTSAGVYTLPYLPAGTYTIRVAAPGFRTATAENVILRVGQVLTVNITLEVGAVAEEVTVSATPPLLESGTAEIGRYISTDEFGTWPTIVEDGQRQIQSFIFRSLPGTTGGEFEGSINGGQQYSHEILIEGIPVGRSDLMGGNNNEMSPSAEAIGEFKLHTGAIGAQYNGGQTAVANFALKSGTNDLHGSAFYYGQNDALNANTLANNATGRSKTPIRNHNYGYSVGGPVYIPKVYDGRNRSFFFTNLEFTDRNDLQIIGFNVTLPNSDLKQGDFSRLFDPAFTGNTQSGTAVENEHGQSALFGQIYDPRSTWSDGKRVFRDPFPGNVIPKSRWNPVARNVVDDVGVIDPDLDRMIFNKVRTSNVGDFDQHIVMVKLDHLITPGNRISGVYNHEGRIRLQNGGYLPLRGPPTKPGAYQETPSRMVRLALDSTIAPNVLNRVAAGYNRFGNFGRSDYTGQDWASRIGVRNTSPAHFPLMNFAGHDWQGGQIGTIGNGAGGAGSYSGSWVLQDDLTVIKNAHTFRVGYEHRNYYQDGRWKSSSGDFQFSPVQTRLPGFAAETGHAFASFLLGAVHSASRVEVGATFGHRHPSHAFYFMDDWKISPKLTVNLGLRWEIIGAFYEVTDRMSMVDVNTPNPGADGRLGARIFGDRFQTTNWGQLGPRLGFAYRVSDHTVFRGGYAITNTPPIRNGWHYGNFTVGWAAPIPVNPGTSDTGFTEDPAMYLDEPYPSLPGSLPYTDPSLANFTQAGTTAPDSNRLTYVQNWNFTIQRQLPWETVLEAAYVGNKGTRVWAPAFENLNALPVQFLALGDTLREGIGQHPELKPYPSFPDNQTVAQALRPYPQYTGLTDVYAYNSSSLYNALQVSASRRFTGGLGILAAYTFSKTIGYSDNNGPMASAVTQDVFHRGLERSVTSFSIPHVFKFSWIWELPVGRGKAADLGWLNHIAGNWTLSGIHNYRSGSPISVGQSGVVDILGSGEVRPDVTGLPQTLGGAPKEVDFFFGTPYLDPAGFAESPHTGNGIPLRLGTAPRYLPNVRGPHDCSEDFRIGKLFRLSERLNLQFAAVFVNAFNRTKREFVKASYYDTFLTNVSSGTFGRLFARGGGRRVQLEGRLEW